MFGVVPKTLWEKKAPADERNRVRLAANSLLRARRRKTIVVETGNGTKWDPKLRKIYGIPDGDPLKDSLARAGVEPEDVDMVINTHLHFDHCGGNTRPGWWPRRSGFSHARNMWCSAPNWNMHESHRARPRQLRRRQVCAHYGSWSVATRGRQRGNCSRRFRGAHSRAQRRHPSGKNSRRWTAP